MSAAHFVLTLARRAGRGKLLVGLLVLLVASVLLLKGGNQLSLGGGPQLSDIPRNQALFQLGAESDNPREYDPATANGSDFRELVFSGLVSFDPQMHLTADLAESWDVDARGTGYTFHLRKNARFHNGKAVTAEDVIYSWERAADPKTNSDTVLTYLGDIVGVENKRAGRADHISGLKALDEHTLGVTIDAPKPYFPMKLTYETATVLDRANVESGPDWYRKPNGTGPYKLVRWDPGKVQIFERNDDFYLKAPALKYVVSKLYAGVGIDEYEKGNIDITGVSRFNAARVRDPAEAIHSDLREGVSMCTSYVVFDVKQPPFDDPKVRQAFALAVSRQQYIDVALNGVGIPAEGLYPPALPGHNSSLKGLAFDPKLAKERLAESRYGSASKLPPITFTTGGFGSDVSGSVSALAGMWHAYLGAEINVENLEPDHYNDEVHAGRHGQLLLYGWCADYPDPENFADALFHSGTEQNLGHYGNAELDKLLEKARVERDVKTRIQMYQKAEQMLVDDAPAVFLNHSLNFVLVKPHIKGYVLTPVELPIERYMSFDGSGAKP